MESVNDGLLIAFLIFFVGLFLFSAISKIRHPGKRQIWKGLADYSGLILTTVTLLGAGLLLLAILMTRRGG